MANNVDPDQTASIEAVCSGSMLFASILHWSVMLGNYLQQKTSADDIFRCIFLGALRVKTLLHMIVNMIKNLSIYIHDTEHANCRTYKFGLHYALNVKMYRIYILYTIK